ncbi:TetR/AcrR family transcriptional regulator [Actinoplanes sp. DH11]|uniref:TetR/AcrR family transcriptional regulator n=1 Tax=Actinoplanes sp. DH11 TaxID=2857011 RepID=UPI001E632D86|nr:TetR/AcrR family transcriptional regulator [Actinoplanes sp. DH11]
MPTPERTSRDAIVAAAREILEADGLARLTMQSVADRVGVRAPSLYKRVRNRDELVRLVATATVADLGEHLRTAPQTLGELARAFRAFAHAHPAGYRLILGWGPETVTVDVELLAAAIAPVLASIAALAGPDDTLEAARLVTAWANGFISMELAGAFNLGGDVEAAFEYALTRLTEAIKAGRAPAA